MILLCFPVFIASSIYAFDFGTQNLRIALGVPGKPIEIVPNEQGSRSSPNFLAYTIDPKNTNVSAAEWCVGSDAERIFHRNASNGIKNPFYYLANPSEKSTLDGIHPSTAAAIAFSLSLRKFKVGSDKIIVAVPYIFSPQARQAIMQSLKFIGITSAQIIDSNSAIASLYAVERLKKLGGENETLTQKILFFDIGAIQTEATLWNFTRIGGITQIELLDYRYSDEIGGDIVDKLLLENITAQLSHQPNRAEMSTIVRSTKRAKERLASGSDQFIDLSEDFQTMLPLSNQVIDDLSQPLLKKLHDLIQGIETPDEIEMVGGSSRLPSIVNVIQETFPNHTLRRSLNSDEAVAFGAAYYSSLQTGTIVGSRLEFIKPAVYGLDFVTVDKKYSLYQTGDLNDRKTMTMRKFTDFNFSIKVTKGENVPKLQIKSKLFDETPSNFTDVSIVDLTKLTRSIRGQLANGTRPYLRFTFGHSQTLDCLDYISSALTANVTVNVTIEGEVNHVDSTLSNWPLSTKTNMSADSFAYNETETNEFIASFLAATEERKRHAAAVHKIETFIIDIVDKIDYDADFRTVTAEEERAEIRDILGREREAIEMSASRVAAADLEKRFEKIKEKIKDPLTRLDEHKKRPAAIARLNATIKRADIVISNITKTTTNTTNTTTNETNTMNEGDKNADDDDDEAAEFKKFLEECRQMATDAEQQQPLEMPKILNKRVLENEKALSRKLLLLKRSINKPKPKPKAKPVKKAEIDPTDATNETNSVNETNSANEIEGRKVDKESANNDDKQKAKQDGFNNEGGIQLGPKSDEEKEKEKNKKPQPDMGGIHLLKDEKNDKKKGNTKIDEI